jgi:hypothetical protein
VIAIREFTRRANRLAQIEAGPDYKAMLREVMEAYKLYLIWMESEGRFDRFGDAAKSRGVNLAKIAAAVGEAE